MPQVNSQPNQSDRSDSTAILDSALLRAGRFDRPITVSPPDQQGRLTILQVHTQSVPLRDPSDLEAIAASTPRMVGADLRNLVNEAALSAVRQGEEAVSPGVRPRTGHLAGPALLKRETLEEADAYGVAGLRSGATSGRSRLATHGAPTRPTADGTTYQTRTHQQKAAGNVVHTTRDLVTFLARQGKGAAWKCR